MGGSQARRPGIGLARETVEGGARLNVSMATQPHQARKSALLMRTLEVKAKVPKPKRHLIRDANNLDETLMAHDDHRLRQASPPSMRTPPPAPPAPLPRQPAEEPSRLRV